MVGLIGLACDSLLTPTLTHFDDCFVGPNYLLSPIRIVLQHFYTEIESLALHLLCQVRLITGRISSISGNFEGMPNGRERGLDPTFSSDFCPKLLSIALVFGGMSNQTSTVSVIELERSPASWACLVGGFNRGYVLLIGLLVNAFSRVSHSSSRKIQLSTDLRIRSIVLVSSYYYGSLLNGVNRLRFRGASHDNEGEMWEKFGTKRVFGEENALMAGCA